MENNTTSQHIKPILKEIIMVTQETIEQITDLAVTERSSAHLSRTVVLSRETALLIILGVVAVFSRLWALGARVMSHDESLHVYYSWLLATGKGFTHNPMMHGPFLFDATALMDVLFAASDFTSRLVPAILGIMIVVLVPQLLKPWLGRAGALAASLLLLISPFVLYFSRYIRHDIQVIAWTLLAIIATFRYLADRSERSLMLLTAALALMLSTMEISFIYIAILVGYLILTAAVKYGISWKSWRLSSEFDLLIVLSTLGAFFSSPIALLLLNPLWNKIYGAPFVNLPLLNGQGIEWSAGISGVRLWSLFALFSAAAVALGLLWNWKRWLKLAGMFALITIPLYTTFFTNPAGFGTGFIGSLGYWLSQQGVARGSQPWYYYLIVLPIYEYLPLLGGILATAAFIIHRKTIPALQYNFVLFLIWWAIWIFTGLSLAGEKMPWLSTHITIPFILLTGWWIGQLLEGLLSYKDDHTRWKTITRGFALVGIGILVVATIRTSIAVNYINYDYTTEFIDYAHGAPGVKWVLNDIAAIADHTGAGQNLKIAYDDEVSWPMTWYLRNYRNQAFYGATPNREALDAPVVLAGPKNWSKVEAILGKSYHRFELIRLWWPMEDYKNLTWDRIYSAISDPAMRAALWDIFWNRDYQKYADLTAQKDLNPPVDWSLAERMRVYIRKDIAAQMLSISIGSTMMEDLPAPVDAYAKIQQQVKPVQTFDGLGLSSPRALAIAPDGSIFVADTGNSRIVHMDPKGNILETWGSRTPDGQVPPAPGTFNEPWGIAIDSQGYVYVADTWNHRVQKFDANGKFLLEWGGLDTLWGPRGIVAAPDGRIYLTDTGNKRVVVFDTNGKILQEFGKDGEGQLDEPVGITLGPDGRVYVADTWNQRVAIFSVDGEYLNSFPVEGWIGNSLDNKPYISVDPHDRVYVTDPERYRVIVFSSDGKPLAVFGQYGPEVTSFGLPVGIAADPDGMIWIVDTANNRLAKFDVWK
jgi:uncharacterized protein (TIGR03663 family)